MELRETTRLIISQVEKVTGIPVHVAEERSLKTLAVVRMAREGAPAHVIAFNPTANMAPDYHISCECGFMLRLYACPLEARRKFVATPQGRREVETMLKGPNSVVVKMRLPASMQNQLRDQLFDGLMLQLRSMAIGMRVDRWLRRDYPDLNTLQEASARKQMQDNSQALGPEVQQMAPEKIYRANVAMNGAFASFWSGILGDGRFVAPYKATKHWSLSARLLEIESQIPDNPTEDFRLVDEWARECGLTGWYAWEPYE